MPARGPEVLTTSAPQNRFRTLRRSRRAGDFPPWPDEERASGARHPARSLRPKTKSAADPRPHSMKNGSPPPAAVPDPFARSRRTRRIAAVRLLAHRLFHRACRLRNGPDLETALRLADERLVPAPGARRAAAAEALRLCQRALALRCPGGPLEGRLETWLAAALEARPGTRRRLVIPTLVHRPGGSLAVVVLRPEGDGRAVARLRDYRRAAEALFGRPAAAVLVTPSSSASVSPGARRARPLSPG